MKVPDFSPIADVPGILPASGGLNTIIGLILAIIQLGLVAVVVLSLFYIIFAGIKWIMSGGDKQGLAAAKGQLTYAIIGLVLSFLVFLILRLVSGVFQFNLGAGIPIGNDEMNSACRSLCRTQFDPSMDRAEYSQCVTRCP